MTESQREEIIDWLALFGEPTSKVEDVDICDNGSVYLGLVQIAPPNTLKG